MSENFSTPYDKINAQDKPFAANSMDELAVDIESRNYGVIRFLTALVRAMMKSEKRKRMNNDTLLTSLMKLVRSGIY